MTTTSFDNLLAPAYLVRNEKAVFGDRWVFEGAAFEHGKETLIAQYPKPEPGDGQPVDVYCTAMPARFYRIAALASEDSVGEPKPAFSMSTGSGMEELSHAIAEAIESGMLSMNRAGEVPA